MVVFFGSNLYTTSHGSSNRRTLRFSKKAIGLCHFDGVAVVLPSSTNAVHLANTPTLTVYSGPLFELKSPWNGGYMPTDDDMGFSCRGIMHWVLGGIFSGASLVNQVVESKVLFQTDLWH